MTIRQTFRAKNGQSHAYWGLVEPSEKKEACPIMFGIAFDVVAEDPGKTIVCAIALLP